MELYVTKMLVGNDEQHSHSGLFKFKSAFQVIAKSCVKKYAGIAFIRTALFFASAVAGIRYKVLLFLDGIFGLGWLTRISITVNFYRKLYLELRKLKRCQTSQVSVLVKTRIERKIAPTVCLLTVTVFIATVPFANI